MELRVKPLLKFKTVTTIFIMLIKVQVACDRTFSWYSCSDPTVEGWSWLSTWYRAWDWVLLECSWRSDNTLFISVFFSLCLWFSQPFYLVMFVETGPHLISFKPYARNVPLQSSMTVTDG